MAGTGHALKGKIGRSRELTSVKGRGPTGWRRTNSWRKRSIGKVFGIKNREGVGKTARGENRPVLGRDKKNTNTTYTN